MKDEGVKVVQSYRLSRETINLIKEKAAQTDASQGDIIDECVLRSINDVVDRLMTERREAEKRRATALEAARSTRRGPGRPSKGILTKRQQN